MCFILPLRIFAQDAVLKAGNRFPDIIFTNIANAPVKEWYLNKVKDDKFYIINFWGTWCSPCIPEMDSLAKLQRKYKDKIQVIAVSDDDDARKSKYLKNKPSGIWLATDKDYTLYHMFNLAYVGQCAIINPQREIVALVRTDSVNALFVEKMLKGDSLTMSAGLNEKVVITDDPFGVDSTMAHNFTVSGYKKGLRGMGKYYTTGPYKNRRLSWINASLDLLYRAAYNIKSYHVQEFFEDGLTRKDVSDFENKQSLYCVDLLVSDHQKDRLHSILQNNLNKYMPIKVREEKRELDVYVLKLDPAGNLGILKTDGGEPVMSFSGRGYEGESVFVKDFAEDYLTNELGLPVVDETSLTGRFNIKTNVEQRDKAGILKSIQAIGFTVEKTRREVPVIIYFLPK